MKRCVVGKVKVRGRQEEEKVKEAEGSEAVEEVSV